MTTIFHSEETAHARPPDPSRRLRRRSPCASPDAALPALWPVAVRRASGDRGGHRLRLAVVLRHGDAMQPEADATEALAARGVQLRAVCGVQGGRRVTKREFIDEHKHIFSGFVLDVGFSRDNGAEVSIKVRLILTKIDQRLGDIYDQLTKVPKPESNGAAKRVEGVKT